MTAAINTNTDPETLPLGLNPAAAMTWFHEGRVAKLKAALEAVAGASVAISPQNLEYPFSTHVKVTWPSLGGTAFEFFVKPEFTNYHGGGQSSCKRIVWQEGCWRSRAHKVGKSFDAILHRAQEVHSRAQVDVVKDSTTTVVVDHAIKVLQSLGYNASLDNCRAGYAPQVGEAWVRPQIGVSLDGKGGATVRPEDAQASVMAAVSSVLMGFQVTVILSGSIVLGEPNFVVNHLRCQDSIPLGHPGRPKILNPKP